MTDDLNKLKGKFTAGQLTPDTFTKWHTRYMQEKTKAGHDYTTVIGNVAEKWQVFEKYLPYLANLK